MVVTGHSHFKTSSIFSAKVGKMAEAQLVALSVVLQELLEELVQPPVVNRMMNWNIWQHCYWKRRGHLPLVFTGCRP